MILEATRIWYRTEEELESVQSRIAFDMSDVEAIEDGLNAFKVKTTNIKMYSGGCFYIVLAFEVALKLYSQNKDYLVFENKSQNEN